MTRLRSTRRTAPLRRRPGPAADPRRALRARPLLVQGAARPGGRPRRACPPSSCALRPPRLPEVDEPTVIHHFVRLSHLNYSVDSGFYPLGSCTMKYNPKVNEWAARLPGFADLHPLAPDALAQGTPAS